MRALNLKPSPPRPGKTHQGASHIPVVAKAAIGTLAPRLVNTPGDAHEQEAERLADRVVQDRDSLEPSGERDSSRSETGKGAPLPGAPLPESLRSYFEPRFGHDFSQVRIHADARAARSARKIGASAYTIGENVVLGEGQYAPETERGRHLLAHELAHVVQKRQGNAVSPVQRRLIATGAQADIDSFFSLAEPASGIDLERDPATNQVTAIGSLGAPTSPAFKDILSTIIDDPSVDAEVNFGTNQTTATPGGGPDTGVGIGLFPLPSDLAAGRVQLIDMDDVLAVEAEAPGQGVAVLAHELSENYQAHFAVATAGVDQFPAAHGAANIAESGVTQDLVGPGERVAEAGFQSGTILITAVHDFENYYRVIEFSQDPATRDVTVSSVRLTPKTVVSTHTVDQFLVDSDAVPATGATDLAAAAASVAAHLDATVLIEGFTDDQGSGEHNEDLSNRRADNARTSLVGLGVDPLRIHIESRGNTDFVAPNDTDANRALNRRVVITVTRPDLAGSP